MLNGQPTKPAVLFVCLGNICRSPMAEGAMRAAAQDAGIDLTIASAGTADYHIGEAPDPRAIAIADASGIDISGLLGRQLAEDDFHSFTHIVALDKANVAGIKARAPRHGTAKVSLLLDVIEGREGEAVPDPYYGDESDFEKCWETISAATKALAKKFANEGAAALS